MDHEDHIAQQASTLQSTLADMLREARLRRGLTQMDIALRAGVSRATVNAAEAGHGVSSHSLFAMMAVLGLAFAPPAPPPSPQPRPKLKDLMRAERERQARFASERATRASTAPYTPSAPEATRRQDALTATPPSARPPGRPRLKDLMAEERARMAQRRAKRPSHES